MPNVINVTINAVTKNDLDLNAFIDKLVGNTTKISIDALQLGEKTKVVNGLWFEVKEGRSTQSVKGSLVFTEAIDLKTNKSIFVCTDVNTELGSLLSREDSGANTNGDDFSEALASFDNGSGTSILTIDLPSNIKSFPYNIAVNTDLEMELTEVSGATLSKSENGYTITIDNADVESVTLFSNTSGYVSSVVFPDGTTTNWL